MVRLLIVPVLLSVPLTAADWIKIGTPNFEIYSAALESDARQTLQTLERARDFFLRVNPTGLPPALPVTVVQFRTAREYEPYRLNANVPAYFTGDEQRDFIVIGNVGDLGSRATVHEYVHVLVKNSGAKIPRWLNEGMADVYSTLEERDGRVVVGAIPSYRTSTLASSNWIRLSDLVAVDERSPLYDEGTRANVFYAQSWLLAHMLMLGEGYADEFPRFYQRVAEVGSQTAFAEVYGKSLAEIQTAMNAYLRGSSLGAQGFTAELRQVEIGASQAAPEFEIEMTLARLSSFIGREDEATRRLDALETKYGRKAEFEEARAYLAWRKQDPREALQRIRAAIELGANGWKTQWDYARLLIVTDADRAEVEQALRIVLETKPDLADARKVLDYLDGQGQGGLGLAGQGLDGPLPRLAPRAEPLPPEPGDDPGERPVLRRRSLPASAPAPAKR